MLIHSVYFWLRNDLSVQESKNFAAALNNLSAVKTVVSTHVGVPAETRRPVIDSSYSFSLILTFRNNKDQESYQTDPLHLAFIEKNKRYWTKVVVYDSIE
jgi:hypothetical protein